MSRLITILVIASLGAGLLYQLIQRLPADALNVGMGVLCGMAASLPISFGLLVALTRRRDQTPEPELRDFDPQPVRYPEPRPAPRLAPQPAPVNFADTYMTNSNTLPPGAPQPQFIVIAPPQGQFMQDPRFQAVMSNFAYPFASGTPQNPASVTSQFAPNPIEAREWRIIGED